MPTQSRGFFSCDYCGLACDTLDEAKEHEIAHCPKRPLSNEGNVASANTPSEQLKYPPGAPPGYGNMGPLQHHDMELYPPPHMRHLGPPEHSLPPHPSSSKLTRSITLMGPHEKTNMSVEDSIACQNIELFEATNEEVEQHSRDSAPVVARQVGIRCIHCAKMPPTAAHNTTFPNSLGTIATNVRMVADNHLIVCGRVPPEVREACDRAASKRAREQQQGEQEGGDGDENDRDQMALIGYCVDFCHRLGVINKQPHKTGIEFADGGEMAHYPLPATTPVAPGRGPPGGQNHPYSADRMGPPMSMERMPFRTPGPPGSMPRGGPQMMGGPVGPEGIAPTPLQSRRDREGQGQPGDRQQPPTFSADRDGGMPHPGYPGSYPPQGPPPGGYGRPDGQGMQTPGQPNYESQEGGAYPPSAQRAEASPPGYHEMPPPFDLPANFPFYQEPNGTWHCKFCSHIHPQYRDPHSIWSSPNGSPPPGQFIDEHLSICRAYYQSMPSPPMYQGPPGPYGPPMMGPQHMSLYGPPPGPWENSPSMQYPGGPPFPYPPHPDSRYPGPEDSFGGDQRGRPGGPPPGVGPGPPAPPVARGGGPPQQQVIPRKEGGSHEAIQHCINHLVNKENEYYARDPEHSKIPRLVLEEDRLLLTDYFYYLMKQLRLCRFSESDRKTRGGKREKIKLGYGGLQCIHCADVPNSRKFFWSNVDRLANSFAEIPGHVLKCRRCPQQTKDALLQLKTHHPEQMARLPRGSQKVFFRRMWRRLHDEDPDPAALATAPSNEENITPEKKNQDSPGGNNGMQKAKEGSDSVASPKSEESGVMQRTTREAARVLSESGAQAGLLSPSSRVLLAIPEDKEWLSDMDCFIRNQLEVFCATEEDVATALSDRKYPVHVGQVGIRCIHCSAAKNGTGAQGQAVAYPFAISGIYESVREFQRLHLDSCENVPVETKRKLNAFKGSSSLSSVLRKYYVLAAKGLGLRDTREGIQSGGESIPINPQAAFSFAESPTNAAAAGRENSPRQRSPSKEEETPNQEKTLAEVTTTSSSPTATTPKPPAADEDTALDATDSEKKRAAPSSETEERPIKLAKSEDPDAEDDDKADE